ncbi:MAG: helix-turn-helix transcriptional regulator [Actinomycetota bacterium]
MSASFGDWIRRGREEAGLSQARVAQLIGRSPATIRSWEQGRSKPSDAGAVAALAAVLGVEESTMLGKAGFEARPARIRTTVSQELSSLAAETSDLKRTTVVTTTPEPPRHRVTTINPPPVPHLSPAARSYLEDPDQQGFYRRRMIATATILILLVAMFWWALGNTWSELTDFIAGFIDQLNID